MQVVYKYYRDAATLYKEYKNNTLFNVNCEGSGCPFFLARD